MFRIHTNRTNRGTPPVYCAPISHPVEIEMSRPVENEKNESKKRGRLPAAIAATYKYLSEGVRIVGEGYSSYDDRNAQ
jgi:hypothetical protein